MRRFLLALALCAAVCPVARPQGVRDMDYFEAFSTATTGALHGQGGEGIRYHVISWTIRGGTASACAVRLVDDTGADVIASATCTSSGISAVTTAGPFNGVAIKPTSLTLSSGARLVVNYGGYKEGALRVAGTFTADTSALATATKQTDGSQKIQVVDGSGNVIGATSNALDVNIKSGGLATETTVAKLVATAASAALTTGPQVMSKATAAAPTCVEGAACPESVTLAGSKRVTVTNLITNDAKGAALTVAPTAIAGIDAAGNVQVPMLDPCKIVAKTFVPINQAATGPLTIVSRTASVKIYICSMLVISATAQNINLVSAADTNCATSPVGLLGGATAALGPNLAANTGWTLGNGDASVAGVATANHDLCLISSGSGQISGVIGYVKY